MSAERRKPLGPLAIVDRVLAEIDGELVDWAREAGVVLCPACSKGKLSARFQTFGVLLPNGEFRLDDSPDADSFIGAECDNEACDYSLAEMPGDGRLRRAFLTSKSRWGDHLQDESLEQAYIDAVTNLIGRHHDKAGRSN